VVVAQWPNGGGKVADVAVPGMGMKRKKNGFCSLFAVGKLLLMFLDTMAKFYSILTSQTVPFKLHT